MGNNCAITFSGTPLTGTYTGWIQLPSGAIQTGSAPGAYWFVGSSATAGTCYNYQYTFGQPQPPASLSGLGFTSTGPGAFTAMTATPLIAYTVNLPAYSMGTNGRIEVKINNSNSSDSANKGIAIAIAGTAMGPSDYQTTPTEVTLTRTVTNQGSTGAQSTLGTTITGGSGASYTQIVPYSATVDTTKPAALFVYLNKTASAVSTQTINNLDIELYPSGPLDTPAPQALTPASATIVPPCAAAHGFTTNAFFVNPTASMIGQYPSGTGFPFQSVAAPATYYSNVTINGVPYLSINSIGDGANPNFFTSPYTTLAPVASANGWYMEVASTLSNLSPDHWPDAYANPVEKNTSGTTPYVEVDGDEQIGSITAYQTFYGSTESTLNWSGGSSGMMPTCCNNLSIGTAGANINRLQENIFGYGYDPNLQETFYCLNGRQQPFTVSTASFNANIGTYHYQLIVGAQSHTVGSGGVPYSNRIRYVAVWTGP
jgi:hypothetical protein